MITRLQRILIATSHPGSMAIPVSYLPTNQLFSCVRGVASYSGNLWEVNNGLTTVGFGLHNNIPDIAVDTHIANGNGTNEVLAWYDQNGGNPFEFATGSAPSLLKESDGTYCLDFGNGITTINGMILTGNHFSFVSSISKTSFIIGSQQGGTSRYFGLGHSTQTSGTSSYSGTPILMKNAIQIPNNRQALYNAVSTGYSLLSYRDIILYAAVNYIIGGYNNAASGSLWALGGHIKEIATGSYATSEHESFEIETKTRHNIV